MADKKQKPIERLFLYPPARAVTISLQEFERRKNALYRIDYGVPIVDEYMSPLMGGDMMVVQGRPGHAKTSICISLARRASILTEGLSKQGDDAIVLFVTWETTVEEFIGLLTSHQSGQTLEMIARGTADLKRIADAAVGVLSDRIYVVGYSASEPNPVPLTLDRVVEVVRYLTKSGKRIALVIWDYLQRMPSRFPGQNDVSRVGGNARGIKDASTMYGFPSVVAVQSGRQVDGYTGLKLPSLTDPQWASTIEQDTDKMLSTTRPCLYMEVGSIINNTSDGKQYSVTENTLAIGFPKQRWGRAGATFILDFDPETLEFKAAEAVGSISDDDEETPF